jgi:SPP1 gp7 family putative phage head morphogenesis protein
MGRKARRRRPPKARAPKPGEREYARAIAEVAEAARAAVDREIVPMLAAWSDEARRELDRVDDVRMDEGLGRRVSDLVRRVAARFVEAIRPAALEDLASRFASRTAQWSRAETDRRVKAAIGVDVFTAEPNLGPLAEVFVAENVALIRTIPERYFAQVEGVVLRGAASGTLPRDMASQLAEQFEVSRRRAAVIARDQVGKFYGEVNKARQQKLGLKTYTWRTVGDNRVRSEHEAREGKVYAWNPEDAVDGVEYLPPEEQPGAPILCRCSAEANVEELLDSL